MSDLSIFDFEFSPAEKFEESQDYDRLCYDVDNRKVVGKTVMHDGFTRPITLGDLVLNNGTSELDVSKMKTMLRDLRLGHIKLEAGESNDPK